MQTTGEIENSFFDRFSYSKLDTQIKKLYYSSVNKITELDIYTKQKRYSKNIFSGVFIVVGFSEEYLAVCSLGVKRNNADGYLLSLLRRSDLEKTWEVFFADETVSKVVFEGNYMHIIRPKSILVFERE